LLADPPAKPDSQPTTAVESTNGAGSSNGAAGAEPPKLPPVERHACKNCGATMVEGQEWCLQCGAGAPGTLASERDWRPLALIGAVGAILLAGAGTAAYAALNQTPVKPPPHVLIAQVVPPAATPPSTLSTPTATPTPTPATPSGKSGSTLGLPPSTIHPPKLPAAVPTPSTGVLSPTHRTTPLPLPTHTTTPSTPTSTTPANTTTGSTTTPAASTPNPILLDTDAASTYNPSGYPASYFGDPSLAIDGEPTTSWTAQVEPKVAPRMAAGLALDFKTPTQLGSLEVITSTPGMTVEVFGANGTALPATITDAAWTRLSPPHLVKKKNGIVKLHAGGKGFRFLVLWLIKAPAASVGTPEAPGHISIGELVPYPPAK
jgi:hypothetical protein